ncbi:MAG: NAD(P)-dependent oxidoreductase [Lachnospirales bacterium]
MEKVFYCEQPKVLEKVYGEDFNLSSYINYKDLKNQKINTKGTKYIFSTWGFQPLTKEEIQEYFPNVECVFYGAGTVKNFGRPFLELGIKLTSSVAANAIPVAEYTMAMIMLANKGIFNLINDYKINGHGHSAALCEKYQGNYKGKVGLIGCGSIARQLIKMLKVTDLELYAYDPYLNEDEAKKIGVVKSSMEFIFKNCEVVSNHLPNLPELENFINKKYFDLMKEQATFINTGRAPQINRLDMMEAFINYPNRTLILDVSDEEPIENTNSEYFKYSNIIMTPHRAGTSLTGEALRMGQYMVDECKRLKNKEELKFEITLDLWERLA